MDSNSKEVGTVDPGTALSPAQQELETIRSMLNQSPDGEYHIPGIRFTDQTPEVVKLHTMVSMLSYTFPDYRWQTADSLFPAVKGLTVRWHKRSAIASSYRKYSDG